jgi:glycosyltransferase involved in cell wall biosynthesis
MRILLNALGVHRGGAVRHLSSFLPALSASAGGDEYVVLIRRSLPGMRTNGSVKVEVADDASASGWLKRTAGDLVFLPARLKREGFDAVVSLANFGPVWSPAPHVLFQRNAIYFSREYLRLVDWKLHAETLMRRRLAVASMRRAAVVVTPSRAMADMIRETCPGLEKVRFETLYHGFDPASLDYTPAEAVRNAGKGWKFFYPAFPDAHKGFPVLFATLAELKRRGIAFTLFTTVDPLPGLVQQAEGHGLAGCVEFCGNVPQNRIGGWYAACDLLLYPSLCESFGFPLLEAMGCGLPIVAASLTVNRELCGEAALYYDPPEDARAAATAVLQALDPDTRDRMRGQARRRLAGFDWGWNRYAREFAAIVASVTEERPHGSAARHGSYLEDWAGRPAEGGNR